MTKVFLLGQDGLNWAIDHDREYTIRFLEKGGAQITNNIFRADIILCVWHKALLLPKFSWLKWAKKWLKAKIIVTITNDISSYPGVLEKIMPYADAFIVPSKRTDSFLEKESNLPRYRIPFPVDLQLFKPSGKSKESICKELQLEYTKLKDKCVIGSFQRDSLGADLTKPKWQKDPDLLLAMLEKLPQDKIVLLLAGPRRHYIIQECKKRKIDFVFYGDIAPIEQGVDDLKQNTQSLEVISQLYHLSDLCIVSSKSEGGPKAIIESTLTKTMIFSTPVGLAGDFLSKDLIYENAEEGAQKIKDFIQDPKKYEDQIQKNYEYAYEEMKDETMIHRHQIAIS